VRAKREPRRLVLVGLATCAVMVLAAAVFQNRDLLLMEWARFTASSSRELVTIGPPIDAVVRSVDFSGKIVLLSASEERIKTGFQFIVYRGDRLVGKVQVIKVYADVSAARVLFTKAGESVQVGDKATTQL